MAWHPLGWTPVGFSEIEAFPSAVLNHHYPNVPNLGDMTRFKDWPDAAIDLLVGGTPCQSFSVAGLRKGLADPRGNLALTYLAIADRYRPEWLVWENVPGVLSSDGGRDFGSIVGAMVELGYSPAWRVLDAQYVRVDGFARAVPQRRRRVFVVGHLGDWRRAAAVLFEPESLSGDSPPRREAGKGIAPTISARPTGGGGLGTDFDLDGGLIARGFGGNGENVARTITTGEHQRQDWETTTMVTHALRADGFDASEDGTGRGTPIIPVAGPLGAGDGSRGWRNDLDQGAFIPVAPSIAQTLTRGAESSGKGGYAGRRQKDDSNLVAEVAQPLRSNNRNNSDPATEASMHIIDGWAVRRLTPTECERLQGFPDGYTTITYRGKSAADGPRYKALGNSMAVNSMRWLGTRIDMVRAISAELERPAA